MAITGIRAGLALAVLAGMATPALAAPCITIFIAGPEELGFRNSCETCTVAVWGWGGGQAVFSLNGKVHSVFRSHNVLVRRYEVGGRSELRVRNEAGPVSWSGRRPARPHKPRVPTVQVAPLD